MLILNFSASGFTDSNSMIKLALIGLIPIDNNLMIASATSFEDWVDLSLTVYGK